MRNKRMRQTAAFLLSIGLLTNISSVNLQAAEASDDASAAFSAVFDGEEAENDALSDETAENVGDQKEDEAAAAENGADPSETENSTETVEDAGNSSEPAAAEEEPTAVQSESMQQEEEETVRTYAAEAETEQEKDSGMEILDRDGDEKVFSVIFSSDSMPEQGGTLIAAVWSADKGQDDLKWYTLSGNGAEYRADIHTADHKSSGSYYVHLYLRQKDGQMVFREEGNFRVSPVAIGSMEITQDAEDQSQAALLLKDVTCPSGIQKILVPVWSRSDQKDIHWYTAEKTGEGQWKADLKYSNHRSSSGNTFHVHVYGTNGIGVQDFAGSTKVQLQAAQPKISIVAEGDGLKASLSDCSVKNPKAVTFAVWSSDGGQKDLRWYSTGKTDAGQASVSIPYPAKAGTYIIHCYAQDEDGKMVFQAPAEYKVSAPSAASVSGKISSSGKSLELAVHQVSMTDNIREVLFAVWSADNGQDDIRWYSGKKGAEDTEDSSAEGEKKGSSGKTYGYTASAAVKNHKGKGPVYVHVYAKTPSGSMIFLGDTKVAYETGVKAEIHGGDLSEESYSAEITAEFSVCSLDIQKVDLAVWSASNQNDIHWYKASKAEKTDSVWKAEFSPKNHKNNGGTYHVHAYVTFANGTQVFAGAADYTPDLDNKYFVLENADGTMTALLYGKKQTDSVNVAVWSSKNGQDDIKWYPLTWNGTCYSAVLSVRNHKHDGTYFAHFYSGKTFLGAKNFTFPVSAVPEVISFNSSWEFGGNSKINSGNAVLYRAGDNRKNVTIGVNAGHGCSGGASVYTLCHPDGTPKVTGGSTAAGAIRAMSCAVGMTFYDGTPERDVTLQEAQILKDLLLENGYDVLMIRDGSDVQLDNIARTLLCNQYADCHIAIHWDGDGLSYDKGCYYMSVPNALKSMYPVSTVWSRSNQLGDCLISGLASQNCRIFQSGSMQMDLTQTSYSKVPSIDIELGNAASNHSRATLEKLANGLLKGIEQYYG